MGRGRGMKSTNRILRAPKRDKEPNVCCRREREGGDRRVPVALALRPLTPPELRGLEPPYPGRRKAGVRLSPSPHPAMHS